MRYDDQTHCFQTIEEFQPKCSKPKSMIFETGRNRAIMRLTYHWTESQIHDDVIKWKHFPRNWPFVRGIHRSPVNSLHKGQWRGALVFYLSCVSINGWVNNREAGDLRGYRAHFVVGVMCKRKHISHWHLTRNIYTCMSSIVHCGADDFSFEIDENYTAIIRSNITAVQ